MFFSFIFFTVTSKGISAGTTLPSTENHWRHWSCKPFTLFCNLNTKKEIMFSLSGWNNLPEAFRWEKQKLTRQAKIWMLKAAMRSLHVYMQCYPPRGMKCLYDQTNTLNAASGKKKNLCLKSDFFVIFVFACLHLFVGSTPPVNEVISTCVSLNIYMTKHVV